MKQTYWLAEGKSLQAVRDYQDADVAWKMRIKEQAPLLLAKYGAVDVSPRGCQFKDRPDTTKWKRDDKRPSWWVPRLRYDNKKVEGGAEIRAEIRNLFKNRPEWSTYNKGLIAPGPEFIEPGVYYSGLGFGFWTIGDAVILVVNMTDDGDESRAPVDCTRRLKKWEVEKMREELTP
uniref:Uncharacterized protein n=1 Tax=uncultured Caudovirales phage TaxID=2100421 RepID=A0A6J5L085_9CAUD|nr:hypothetical protein UFOVP114_14 [uncultured Caudovirales phage]